MAEHPEPAPNFDALRLQLSKLRNDRGWSYDELAERSGVSRATLIAMETGSSRARNPGRPASRGSLESWWRVSRAFHIPFSDFLAVLD